MLDGALSCIHGCLIARGQISTTFKYSNDYLETRWAFPTDPALPLSTAPFNVSGMPGAFGDCAPDRWGRNLVIKQHRRLVAAGDVRDRRLTEVDICSVSAIQPDRELSGSGDQPPGTTWQQGHAYRRRELQQAADEAADGSGTAIKRLLEPGTGSLGGARPKASVSGDDGRLLIAKFSRPSDEWSVILWESVALEPARRAGITVPDTQLLRMEDRPVLLLDGFDRDGRQRIGYISAMTAADRHDGEAADCVDVIEAIEDTSRQRRCDCRQLFRSIALSTIVHNTDDHLRNHGFLRTDAGWELSPAFDINPEPDIAVDRQAAINGVTEAEHEAEALLELAALCHLTDSESRTILSEVVEAVGQWRACAVSLSVPAAELESVGGVIDKQLERIRAALG